MSQILGRTVRLFLVEGKPTGLITAEIINWTGQILTGPRSSLAQFLARPEVARTGIYLLYGPDPEEPERLVVYIGETDHVGNRLKQHNQEDTKLYWERTCVVTSKDQNITKAHARYLEARLIGIALSAGRARLENDTAPAPPKLPEADRSDMEYFIDQIRLVLPVLGLDVLRESAKPSVTEVIQPTTSVLNPDSPTFELTGKNGVQAKAREIDGDFIVLKGSRIVAEWKQTVTATTGYAKLHQKLRDGGKLAITHQDPLATLTEDVAFSSPSAAATVIFGQNKAGPTSWKLQGSQQTYRDWQNQQIQALVPPTEATDDAHFTADQFSDPKNDFDEEHID